MKFRFPRESFIPKGSVKITDKHSTAVAYFYTSKGGTKPGAVCFRGKADKPAHHYTFKDDARRETFVKEFFKNVRDYERRRVEDRQKRTAFVHSVQVGDIYRTSWGYDQTNVEFFEVVEVKGKYAILREIQSASEGGGPGGERCVPQSGAYVDGERGAPIRRLIQQHGIKICDVRTGYPWGKRGPGGIVIGESCYRTSSGWGH